MKRCLVLKIATDSMARRLVEGREDTLQIT